MISSNLPFTGPDDGGLPIGPLFDLPNGIDPFLIPPENRCGWYVPCGTYVMLNDDDEFFDKGDSFELDQVLEKPFVMIDISISHPLKPFGDYPCQPTRYGVWTGERISVPGFSQERFVYRVAIDVCRNRLPLMECTVDVQSSEDVQLICDDDRTWMLCQSPLIELEKLNIDCPDVR